MSFSPPTNPRAPPVPGGTASPPIRARPAGPRAGPPGPVFSAASRLRPAAILPRAAARRARRPPRRHFWPPPHRPSPAGPPAALPGRAAPATPTQHPGEPLHADELPQLRPPRCSSTPTNLVPRASYSTATQIWIGSTVNPRVDFPPLPFFAIFIMSYLCIRSPDLCV